MLLASASSAMLCRVMPPRWPDGVDTTLTVTYLALIFGIPMLGYVAMVLDIRRYLRSLRRALVVVSQVMPSIPYWALLERPACLRALGLELPCDEPDVMAAYRERAKDLHPDRGGELQQFLRLQKHLEEALHLVRSRSATNHPRYEQQPSDIHC